MTPERLSQLLATRERETVEFKKAAAGVPSSVYETICAFLNHRGGDILLGVADDGTVLGVPDDTVDQICADIASATSNGNLFSPPYLVYPQKLQYQGQWIVHIQVPESSQTHQLRGVVYDRGADGDFKVSDPEGIARIVNRKRMVYSETRTYPHLTLDALDADTLQRVRNRIGSVQPGHPWLTLDTAQFLRKAGLLVRDSTTGQESLCLAAVVLFGTEDTLTQLMPYFKIDALLRRQDVDRYDDRLLVRTNIVEAYLRLMEFIERHLPDPFYMERDVRISLRDKIFRELVANLLVHREYTKADVARILIYQDRVEFSNPTIPHWGGNFDPDTIVPFQKNPLISKMFLQLGWVEEIGSGLMNVKKYLPRYAPQGSFTVRESDIFSVTVYLAPVQATQQVTQQVTSEETQRRFAAVLEFCEIPRTRKEIQDMLGLKDRENFRVTILTPLLNSGQLELLYPDRPRSSHQKYVRKRLQP